MNAMGQRQRGIVAVMVAISLLALLAMVGMALESGHVILNKSRLQNTVDASALAAAKVLDRTGSETQATTAARSIFTLNAANQPELSRVMSGADITVQYSNTLSPFAPGSVPANYVRVIAQNFTMWTSFTSLVGINQTSTAASAVAGPSAPVGLTEGNQACSLVPMMVCADMTSDAPGDFGYTPNNITMLKIGSNVTGPIGPGNFQLFELGGSGANIVRQNLAGGYDGCIDPGDTITTKPGNNVGPTAQGLNTRFGEYQGGGMNQATYPPDWVTMQPTRPVEELNGKVVFSDTKVPINEANFADLGFTFADYNARTKSGQHNFPSPIGRAKRRVLAVPFVDCTNTVNGHGTIPVVTLGCFYLAQKVIQKGNENFVFGEYIGQEECLADGTPGPVPDPDPVNGPGIYKIVLHNDPLSPDS
jgi:Flp pilus assembly protein TadG